MIPLFLLSALLSTNPALAQGPDALSSLFKSVTSFLNGPVRRAPRVAAVMAVRGGIPTDQGEDLDLRLLDRARALRAALLRPDPAPGDARALASIYEALAASEFVQTLAVAGGVTEKIAESKNEAADALAKWATAPRARPLPGKVKALMTGPASVIDDKALVAAGWGGYVRALSPSNARPLGTKPGWSAPSDAARLDEALKSVRDSLSHQKLDPEAEANAHVLAGRLLRALAQTDMRGEADAGSATSSAASPPPVVDDGDAPAPAAEVPFDPKAIYQKAAKSVGLIICASNEGSGELGTGSIVDAGRRRLLTNAHVVIRDSTREPWPVIRVYFKPTRMSGDPKKDMVDPIEGRVIAFDRALDLALVELPRLPAGAGAIALGDPRAIDIGDRVATIGHPEQGGLWTLTTGVISSLVANIGGVSGKNAFQTDASINRGNSGGPLLDARGHIVGVNTSMARKATDGLAITAVNFAVRSDVARTWMAAHDQPLAYGTGPAAPAAVASVSAPAAVSAAAAPAAPAAAPTPTAAPAVAPATPPASAATTSTLAPTTPAPATTAPAVSAPAAPQAAPKRVTITESKPYNAEDVIAAEIAKMEELGDEMHQEIQKKLGR